MTVQGLWGNQRVASGVGPRICARVLLSLVVGTALSCGSGADESANPPASRDAGTGKDAAISCKAATCASLQIECGKAPDSCGGVVDCGVCAGNKICGGAGANRCGEKPCVSKTCAQLGANCGSASDGCSTTLDCGVCVPPKTCGGGSVPSVCGCMPATCASLGKSCGSVADGCGGTLECGGCFDGVTDGVCVDNVCVHNCMGEAGYGNCGADSGGWGGGDCDSSNQAGCLGWWFDGWCNRRKDYSKWLGVMQQWTNDRCDTHVVQVEPPPVDGETLYHCLSSGLHKYECYTPLVLVFRGEPVRFEPCVGPFFDIGAQGTGYQVDCPTAPWLALDRNLDGRINDGSELFGSATLLRDGRRAADGFEALAELDSNGDGRLSAADVAWDQLIVWTQSAPAQLPRLSDRGVESLELTVRVEPSCDPRGNCVAETATLHYRDGLGLQVGEIVDVHLRIRPARQPSQATNAHPGGRASNQLTQRSSPVPAQVMWQSSGMESNTQVCCGE